MWAEWMNAFDLIVGEKEIKEYEEKRKRKIKERFKNMFKRGEIKI